MRILQVSHLYCPHIGGVEEHVRNISEQLIKNNEVTIATTDPTGELPEKEILNDVTVLRFKTQAPRGPYHFSRGLQNYLQSNSKNFDIIHAHNYHAFPSLYAANSKNSNRLIVTPHYHGSTDSFLRNLLLVPYRHFGKKIFSVADQVICVSNYERDLLLKHFKIDFVKMRVLPNGVSFSDFNDVKKRKSDHKTILFVGRLERYKGVQNIIQALPNLDKNIVLKVIGDGSFKTNLVKQIQMLGLEERVFFLKDLIRSDLIQEYVDADLFITLSEHESYGLCVAEAMAAGTLCIVANSQALTEWVDNRGCFGIDDPKNSKKLSELITLLIYRENTSSHERHPRLIDWNEVVEILERDVYHSERF